MKKFLRKHRTQAIAAAGMAILLTCMAVVSVMYSRAVIRGKKAESLENKDILSKAIEFRSNGQFQEALTKVETIINSEHIGPKARLLRARLVLELQGPADAVRELEKLLNERDEIACQAHFLLARIYLESDPGDLETTEEYQRKAKEHQQKGEKLFSESAEAYFNRSMMAGTVNKTLEWLNKAVDFDPGHYDSREARALAYYALRKYDGMEIDASVMIGNESNNSKGYALRAIARREKAIREGEKEFLSEAIRDHNKAIKISPAEPELYNQRRRTHLRIGNYEQALSDARKCVELQSEENIYHFHVFCVLVASARYDEAKVKYDTIIKSGLMTKSEIDLSAAKYVSDTLDAGLSWHPPEGGAEGAAFLAMRESDEIYHQLAKKATRVVPEGFCPTWSPDRTELAYSGGILGFAGIEIVNLENGETRLLTVPGFDPAWSPDGHHVAFVRYRQTLLLADLTTEHATKYPPQEQREVWLIKADGTEDPRFLTRGSWPSWSHDSKRVFYHSQKDMKLYSISIEDSAKPTSIISCPRYYPAVSPDEKYVAYVLEGELRIVELSSKSVIASWTVTSAGVYLISWSPDGQKLILPDRLDLGLWIYDVKKKKASKILSGSFGWCNWSRPDMNRMAIERQYGRGLHRELWVAKLDPNVSTTEALGPGRTLEEHYQEMVDFYTRRIKTVPEDAENYFSRAACYAYLQEYEKATADLEELAKLRESGDQPGQLTSWMNRLITDLAVGCIEKYGMGAYEQALATLTGVDKLRRAANYEPSPADVSFIAMSLHRLGRDREAQAALDRLRSLYKDGKHADELRYLRHTEQLFASESSKVYLVWECIEAGKLKEASQLIEELRSLPRQEYTEIAAHVQSIIKFLARVYFERGRSVKHRGGGYGEAIGDYEAAVRIDPAYARAFSDLAWLQAACPATDFRDGAKAVENANKACELTEWKDHRYVDTLAAVSAEVGDFTTAVKWQKQATDLLTEDKRAKWQAHYESRLKLYQSGKPYDGGNLWSFSTGRIVGWWKFDDGRGRTALDWSGHGNHGTLRGDPQWVGGIIGGALDLDGSDFVTIDGVVDDITSNNITVSAWVKTTTTMEGNLFASNSGTYHAFMFGIQGGNVYVSDDLIDEGLTPIAVNDGQWHMWTYVRRGSRGYIYVDAVQESTHSADFDLATETRWSVGQEWDPSGPSDFLTGTVDDARIYSYALSEDEIKALYAGKGLGPTEP